MNMKTLMPYLSEKLQKIMTIITRDWSTTTPAPTSPPPAIVLDPIMEEMMNMVNWTELEARF